MPDWTKSMVQTFEYYKVNTYTWMDEKKINSIKSSSIVNDSESELVSSATFEGDGGVGECYIRIYLVTIQNGITEKFPLGTFLAQSEDESYNTSIDAYSPLTELKDDSPDYGYILENSGQTIDAIEKAMELIKEHQRAPVIDSYIKYEIGNATYVANQDDTWFSFIKSLLDMSDCYFSVSPLGEILIIPNKDLDSLSPVWTFNEDNNSIIYPEISVKNDIYKIPNVVEVIYSQNGVYRYGIAKNESPSSPVSIQNRNRVIKQRIINPNVNGLPTNTDMQNYAEKILKSVSKIQYEVSYKHGYCPVRVGDCVRLNCPSKKLYNVKAVVKSQNIKCSTGCEVSEKAIYTKNLLE